MNAVTTETNLRADRLVISYVGEPRGTSLHRANALQRLGHEVTLVDPWKWLGNSRWVSQWLHHTGGMGAGLYINKRILADVTAADPDLIFVNQGAFLGPALLQRLRNLRVPIVNYTSDNPFSGRNSARFRNYRLAVPFYDLVVVTSTQRESEALKQGARSVMRVWFSADERAHKPRDLSPELESRFASDVAFIGTWMPERGPFMAALIQKQLPLSIWGDRWQKAPEWPLIAPHWRGSGLWDDREYAAAIQSAKVCIGLLSKLNRDLHTQRSVEIPSLGALLCAERTSEHLVLYNDGEEAVFWRDAEECSHHCQRLLDNETLRREIACRGHARALRNGLNNEATLSEILSRALQCSLRYRLT